MAESKKKQESLTGMVKRMQMTLENEVKRGIQIIAEGHLDLNRKLDQALKTAEDKEILHLRVCRLESEMEKVKSRLEETA